MDKASDFVSINGDTVHLDSPLLNIEIWGVDNATGLPRGWLCDGIAVMTSNFSNFKTDLEGLYSANATGFCQAGSEYQWGFSFLLVFITCVFQLLYAISMYSLWIEARRNSSTALRGWREVYAPGDFRWRGADWPSVMSHAVNMVRQAEEGYGEEIKSWSAKRLDKVIWRGSKGMRTSSAE